MHSRTAGSTQTANEPIFEAFHLGFLACYRNTPVAHSGLTAAKLSLSLALALYPEIQRHTAVESQGKATFQTCPGPGMPWDT